MGESNDGEQEGRAAYYRQTARTLHRLAAEIRFDFRRQSQLSALASAFDRLAEKVEKSLLEHAAD